METEFRAGEVGATPEGGEVAETERGGPVIDWRRRDSGAVSRGEGALWGGAMAAIDGREKLRRGRGWCDDCDREELTI